MADDRFRKLELAASDEDARGLAMSVQDAGNPPDVDSPTQASAPTAARTALTAKSPANGSSSGANASFAVRGRAFADRAESTLTPAGVTGCAHFKKTGLPP